MVLCHTLLVFYRSKYRIIRTVSTAIFNLVHQHQRFLVKFVEHFAFLVRSNVIHSQNSPVTVFNVYWLVYRREMDLNV